MSEAIAALKSTITHLENILDSDPFAIVNESEFQALLQIHLLEILSDTPPLVLAEGLNNRRPGT